MIIKLIIRLFKLIAPMIVHHEAYLPEIVKDEQLRKEYDFKSFVLPLLIISSVSVGLGYFLNGSHYRVEVLIIRAVFYFLSMIGSYFISIKLIQSFVYFLWEMRLKRSNLELFVATSLSILVIVDVLIAFLPVIFFIQFAKFFVIIIMATLAPELFKIRQKIVPMLIVLSVIIINVVPFILRKLLYLMVPNI